MTIHMIFASIFIACIIGLITSIILHSIGKKDYTSAIIISLGLCLVFGLLSVITGSELHDKLHYREIHTPELEDVSEHKAKIDTIYTICDGKIDTTYSAHWIGRKTGRR